MVIVREFGSSTPLHHAKCWKSELTDGQNEGTYELVDADIAASLGDGSDIVVMDVPGRVLFWNAAERVAYDWTATPEEAGT